MVDLLWVSLLGVEATLKGEFMAVLISQKFLLLVRQGKLQEGFFLHPPVESQMSST